MRCAPGAAVVKRFVTRRTVWRVGVANLHNFAEITPFVFIFRIPLTAARATGENGVRIQDVVVIDYEFPTVAILDGGAEPSFFPAILRRPGQASVDYIVVGPGFGGYGKVRSRAPEPSDGVAHFFRGSALTGRNCFGSCVGVRRRIRKGRQFLPGSVGASSEEVTPLASGVAVKIYSNYRMPNSLFPAEIGQIIPGNRETYF